MDQRAIKTLLPNSRLYGHLQTIHKHAAKSIVQSIRNSQQIQAIIFPLYPLYLLYILFTGFSPQPFSAARPEGLSGHSIEASREIEKDLGFCVAKLPTIAVPLKLNIQSINLFPKDNQRLRYSFGLFQQKKNVKLAFLTLASIFEIVDQTLQLHPTCLYFQFLRLYNFLKKRWSSKYKISKQNGCIFILSSFSDSFFYVSLSFFYEN